jgi:putative transposase
MDWHPRKVLAWRISNTLDAGFCGEALNEAMQKLGPPEIMNTDQGSQFTSFAYTDRLRRSDVRISMDGKGRFLDTIFIERLWRSLKYECVYLHAWETGSEAKTGIRKWIDFYNHKRPHSALGGQPPAVIDWQRNETTQPDQQVQKVAEFTPIPVRTLGSTSKRLNGALLDRLTHHVNILEMNGASYRLSQSRARLTTAGK